VLSERRRRMTDHQDNPGINVPPHP
jgi:hypothetical protein